MASILQIRRNAKLFHSLENEEQLAALMRIPLYQIQLQASKPLYDIFETKKKNGKKRIIEDPNDLLKAIQSKLNSYLQAVYYNIRPANVYGFCINTNNEEDLYKCIRSYMITETTNFKTRPLKRYIQEYSIFMITETYR